MISPNIMLTYNILQAYLDYWWMPPYEQRNVNKKMTWGQQTNHIISLHVKKKNCSN